MTKKDYELIARAITLATSYCETANQRRGVERATRCISSALAMDNPRFDSARFIAACGIITTTTG